MHVTHNKQLNHYKQIQRGGSPLSCKPARVLQVVRYFDKQFQRKSGNARNPKKQKRQEKLSCLLLSEIEGYPVLDELGAHFAQAR